MACVVVASEKKIAAAAIDLIILLLLIGTPRTRQTGCRCGHRESWDKSRSTRRELGGRRGTNSWKGRTCLVGPGYARAPERIIIDIDQH